MSDNVGPSSIHSMVVGTGKYFEYSQKTSINTNQVTDPLSIMVNYMQNVLGQWWLTLININNQ